MNDAIRGRFIWHELITNDPKAAAAFYGTVAGLTTQAAPSESGYTMLVAGGYPMGGVLDTAVMGGSPRWLSFFVSTDTDATVRQAESLGAKVLKGPQDIPGGGRAAILEDPQGAAFAVWSSPNPTHLSGEAPLGGISWHELATSDRAAAWTFYTTLFGWHETSSMDMGPQGVYQMFAPSGATEPYGGIYTKAPDAPGGSNWLPYIKVRDARPATALAKKNGATILNGPMQVPGGGWITMGIDPQGAAFALHSAAAAAKAEAPVESGKPAKTRTPAKKAPAKKAAAKTPAKKTPAPKAPVKKSARPAKKAPKK